MMQYFTPISRRKADPHDSHARWLHVGTREVSEPYGLTKVGLWFAGTIRNAFVLEHREEQRVLPHALWLFAQWENLGALERIEHDDMTILYDVDATGWLRTFTLSMPGWDDRTFRP